MSELSEHQLWRAGSRRGVAWVAGRGGARRPSSCGMDSIGWRILLSSHPPPIDRSASAHTNAETEAIVRNLTLPLELNNRTVVVQQNCNSFRLERQDSSPDNYSSPLSRHKRYSTGLPRLPSPAPAARTVLLVHFK